MLAVQLSPPSLVSFPYLITPPTYLAEQPPRRAPPGPPLSIDTFTRENMSSKGSSSQSKKPTTSVFNALGSYAEKIRDTKGKPVDSSPASASEPIPKIQNMATSASSSRSRGIKGEAPKAQKEAPSLVAAAVEEDDGPWETVQSSRQRTKHEDKEKKSAANTSRNWRERPAKESNGSGSSHSPKEAEESTKRTSSKGTKKTAASTPNTPASSGLLPEKDQEQVMEKLNEKVSTAGPIKPAWGVVAPVAAASAGSIADPKSLKSESQSRSSTALSSRQPSRTKSSSPAVGTNAADAARASPDPSGTAESTFTVTITSNTTATTQFDRDDGESWRSKPKDSGKDIEKGKIASMTSKPTTPSSKVNAWDLRKKNLGASSSTPLPSAAKTALTANGAVTPPAPTTDKSNVKNAVVPDEPPAEASGQMSGKKKQVADEAEHETPASDPTSWPDVAQAAEVIKKEDDKKDKLREKKDADGESVVNEETGVSGKKHKWKSIPAAELQAAADEQAENIRRQAAAKKRQAKGDGSGQPPPTARGKSRKGDSDRSKIGAVGSNAGSRVPSDTPLDSSPIPAGQEGSFMGTNAAPSFAASAPLSRQSSNHSRSSPSKRSTHLASPGRITNHLQQLPQSSPQSPTGTSTATANAPFAYANGTGPHVGIRPPRVRDARGSFSSRGRGGFRGTSGMKPFTSPVMGTNGLPADGSVYARGFGMGYGFYSAVNAMPMAGRAHYAQQQVAFDPVQAQYNMQLYNRGAPPPPMPQTVVPNIDAHRFYVLGQVEYYFSMQNLAMDFFLRQQMDSEGWIDISMVASFNRLRSLTPDVAMVKEVMQMSSILEVREDKVRLAGQESKRWVLPNAPTSSFPPDPLSPTKDSVLDEQQSQLSVDHEITNMALELAGLDAPYTHAPGGVKNALMKSVAPSSAASVSNGEAGNESLDKVDVDDTPATSTSGDEVKELR